MERPESVNRILVKMDAYDKHVVARFAFGADFRSTNLSLSATVTVEANKTMPIQDIERMANKVFVDLLQATILKCQDGI